MLESEANVVENVADNAMALSKDADAAVKTSFTVSGLPNTATSVAPSLKGMPLQKSDANCNSAKPRAKYISPMSLVGVGLYLFSNPIAWLADVRTRYN